MSCCHLHETVASYLYNFALHSVALQKKRPVLEEVCRIFGHDRVASVVYTQNQLKVYIASGSGIT